MDPSNPSALLAARRFSAAFWLRAACLGLTMLSHAAPVQALDLQGHRGARGLAPENTLPAFERALAIGVHTLELDVGISADDVPVIHHDPALNADTTRDAQGNFLTSKGPALRALSFAQLQTYDVGRLKPGTPYAARFPTAQAIDGTRIPALRDLFARLAQLEKTDARYRAIRFNIETKLSPLAPDETAPPERFVELMLRDIRAAQLEQRVTLQSFDWRTLQLVQRLAPQIPTVYLSAQQPGFGTIDAAKPEVALPWTAGYKLQDHGSVPAMVKAAGGKVWSPYFADVTPALLAQAQQLGLLVVVWTVNEAADIERMLALGVDGIISDYPDRVRLAMQARGMALPPALGP